MRRILTAASAAILLTAGIGLQRDTANAAVADPPVVSPTGNQPSLEELAKQFAADTGYSVDDARAALQMNGAILDQIDKHRSDPLFGALWVTYSPYRVHLRTTSQASALEKEIGSGLGRAVDTTIGGLSASDLDALGKAAVERMKTQDAPFDVVVDQPAGRIKIRSRNAAVGKLSDKTDLEFRDPPTAPAATGYGGLAFWVLTANGWVPQCTGGFMVKGTNYPYGSNPGILTAGHCWDYSSQWYNGETATGLYDEVCGGGDQQIHMLTGTANNWVAADNPVWVNVVGAGGGYYINQPVQKRGRTSGGSSGTITEYIIGANIGGDPNNPSDCGVTYTLNSALRVTNTSQPGDSGGPLVTLYWGSWLAMGITSGGNQTGSTINPMWNISTPGWALCTTLNC